MKLEYVKKKRLEWIFTSTGFTEPMSGASTCSPIQRPPS